MSHQTLPDLDAVLDEVHILRSSYKIDRKLTPVIIV
jgi:hypothetical protein